MSILYMFSTLKEYTWTCIFRNKTIHLSAVSVSKTQAVTAICGLFFEIEQYKTRIEQIKELNIQSSELDYHIQRLQSTISADLSKTKEILNLRYKDIVTTLDGQQFTVEQLLIKVEPTIKKFNPVSVQEN